MKMLVADRRLVIMQKATLMGSPYSTLTLHAFIGYFLPCLLRHRHSVESEPRLYLHHHRFRSLRQVGEVAGAGTSTLFFDLYLAQELGRVPGEHSVVWILANSQWDLLGDVGDYHDWVARVEVEHGENFSVLPDPASRH